MDFELDNEPEFLEPLMSLARRGSIRVILAFHDFQGTPTNEAILAMIAAMQLNGADIAKIAVMPRCHVGKEASAPGQIPIQDARAMTQLLLRYS